VPFPVDGSRNPNLALLEIDIGPGEAERLTDPAPGPRQRPKEWQIPRCHPPGGGQESGELLGIEGFDGDLLLPGLLREH